MKTTRILTPTVTFIDAVPTTRGPRPRSDLRAAGLFSSRRRLTRGLEPHEGGRRPPAGARGLRHADDLRAARVPLAIPAGSNRADAVFDRVSDDGDRVRGEFPAAGAAGRGAAAVSPRTARALASDRLLRHDHRGAAARPG